MSQLISEHGGIARSVRTSGGYTETQAAIILAEARVHAALALAAATALGNVELREWREMAGTKLNDPE